MHRIEVPPYIKGLIFDCDGTLVDSMPLHMKAWEHVIRLKGGPWDYDFFFSKKGMPEQSIVNLYNKHFTLQLNPGDTPMRLAASRKMSGAGLGLMSSSAETIA